MAKNPRYRSYLVLDLTLVGLICLLVSIFYVQGTLDYFNGKLFDLFIVNAGKTPEHCDDVVIVCIDQKSIDYFADNGIGWPWPREFHAKLTDYLTACGANAIVFDVIFTERDIERAGSSTSYESDMAFAESVEQSGQVYLAAVGQKSSYKRPLDPSSFLFQIETVSEGNLPSVEGFRTADMPLSMLSDAARGLGLVNLLPDSDGIYRRYPIAAKVGNYLVPSLGMATIEGVLSPEELDLRVKRHVGDGHTIARDGTFLINWYGPGGTERGQEGGDAVFRYYSYQAAIQSSIQMDNGEEPAIPVEAFRDKIVVVGSNAPGLFDLKATPFTYLNIYPGSEILATAIENMYHGDYIRRVSPWTVIAALLLTSMLLFIADRKIRKLIILMPLYVLVMIAFTALSYVLLKRNDIWYPSAEPLLAATLVFAGLVISDYLKEAKERRFIHDTFGKYLAPAVVDYIIENPETLNQMDGERRLMTIFFSDIERFTTISEELGPERLVRLINEYFEEMTTIIMNNRGTVDRFEGDAIMAFFGAPVQFDDHAQRACIACIEMQQKLDELRIRWRKQGIPLIHSRMGVNSGPVMVGNLGSFSRKQYSVVGDAVNLAARLETINKQYGTYLLIGESTYEAAASVTEAREIDIVRVVGKTQPVRIYELLGKKGLLTPEQEHGRDQFAHGLALYRERKFDEALGVFARIADAKPLDRAARTFVRRCEAYRTAPPPDGWDGVYAPDRK